MAKSDVVTSKSGYVKSISSLFLLRFHLSSRRSVRASGSSRSMGTTDPSSDRRASRVRRTPSRHAISLTVRDRRVTPRTLPGKATPSQDSVPARTVGWGTCAWCTTRRAAPAIRRPVSQNRAPAGVAAGVAPARAPLPARTGGMSRPRRTWGRCRTGSRAGTPASNGYIRR